MRVPKWVREHGLSLSFASLFMASLGGQSLSGYYSYNADLAMHGLAVVGYLRYLTTGNFLDGVFTNWQAALLQLACLVVFAAKFREKGAAHALSPRTRARKKRTAEGETRPWIYRHSLSVALVLLFAVSFGAHLCFGARDYNSRLRMIRKPPVTTVDYGLSSAFWFTDTQTWEAEFAAIAIYVILSIFLRQQGSPESKPVESSNKVTGQTNH